MNEVSKNNVFDKSLFGQNFKWGVSTSAYQIEGAHDTGGKGNSIWDKFSEEKGRINNGHHGKITCDFYNRFEDDLKLIKELNIPNFRFSISWSRILPKGIGDVNQEGIDYYNKIIDSCIEKGIEPWITLYHWDLPHELEAKGGWTNRKIIYWFTEYVEICAHAFGDRVKHWMVLNEPMVFTGAGYFLGVHAPGKKGLSNFLPALHHAVLAQAQGIRVLKSIVANAEVGTTISCSHIEPYDSNLRNSLAAKRIDILVNRMFLEPLLGRGYPIIHKKLTAKLNKYILPGDEILMKADFDFIGIQNYTREIVKHSWYTPFLKAKIISADKRSVPITAMNWEIYPESIYNVLKQFGSYAEIKKIIITENGAAFNDTVVDEKVEDFHRKEFLENYLQQVLRARKEGVCVEGYFVWSLLDNFEWSEGFYPRFGIVHVDFETQKRTIKASGAWFKEFLK